MKSDIVRLCTTQHINCKAGWNICLACKEAYKKETVFETSLENAVWKYVELFSQYLNKLSSKWEIVTDINLHIQLWSV